MILDFGQEDWATYKPKLVQYLRLFGAGIRESLTRTCHEHLPISPGATRRTGGGLDADLRYWSPRRERQR